MVRITARFLILAAAALSASAHVLPRAPGTQFITGPCKSDVDCASDCCGFNTGKCAGPVIAQERDGGCGFGDATPNNRAAQRIQGANASAAPGVPKADGGAAPADAATGAGETPAAKPKPKTKKPKAGAKDAGSAKKKPAANKKPNKKPANKTPANKKPTKANKSAAADTTSTTVSEGGANNTQPSAPEATQDVGTPPTNANNSTTVDSGAGPSDTGSVAAPIETVAPNGADSAAAKPTKTKSATGKKPKKTGAAAAAGGKKKDGKDKAAGGAKKSKTATKTKKGGAAAADATKTATAKKDGAAGKADDKKGGSKDAGKKDGTIKPAADDDE